MKPADICTTLLLPTLVTARRPTFSLWKNTKKIHHSWMKRKVNFFIKKIKSFKLILYTDAVEPVPVPHNPSINIPIPCKILWKKINMCLETNIIIQVVLCLTWLNKTSCTAFDMHWTGIVNETRNAFLCPTQKSWARWDRDSLSISHMCKRR